ncbi:hypothetical protein HU761_11995 [Pseudomonas sp. SWRI59]|uniref:hypothetical protein n=1 Tax=Pseudomonas TaxID=286 RepID=UPI001646F114|nr:MULTISPECIES: hypothetical protein [unclassified Pseudomonas]MBC3502138.1 hypothetical protein [Pseudomonas sp. SWRI59]MBC3507146.1 hypothetical protein [Pseudomonas sp. SWRI68]
MLSKKEKQQIVQDMIDFLESSEYKPLEFSRHTYLISIDEKIHRSDDAQLNELMYILSGMDAGEEFTLTKNEVLEILRSYLLSIK